MLDALLDYFVHSSGISLADALLAALAIILARQRINAILETGEETVRRLDRLEKTFILYGMKLYREDE